jgi:hypothetical protein
MPCQKHLFSHSILGSRRDPQIGDDEVIYLQRRVEFLQDTAPHLHAYCTHLEICTLDIPKPLRLAFTHITHLVFNLSRQPSIDWGRISSVIHDYGNLQHLRLSMPQIFLPHTVIGSIALDPHLIQPHLFFLSGHASHIALLLKNHSTLWSIASISALGLEWNAQSRELDAAFSRLHRFPAMRHLNILPLNQSQISGRFLSSPHQFMHS